MERLTKRVGNKLLIRIGDLWSDAAQWAHALQAHIHRMADLEDQLESGELVRVVRCKDCKKRFTSMCAAKHERADMDYCSTGQAREPGK